MDVQVLDQRLTMKYHRSKVRLREFVWVGGHVNVGWVSGPSVLVSRGQGAVDVGGPVAPSGRASERGGAGVYTDWRKRSLGTVLGHLCTLLRREGHASGCVGAQECTQIDENSLSGPFWDMRIIPTNESMRSTFRKTPLDVG